MPHHTSKSRFEKHPKATIFFLVLIAILLIDIIGTGAYHLIKFGSIHKTELNPIVGQPHPIFHHTLLPNLQSVRVQWGDLNYSLTTDSLGFKNKTVQAVPLKSEMFRILFMGDSFTEGIGMDYDQTFVGLINQHVSPQGPEILNGAVSSYSPAIYYLKTKHLLKNVGLKFNHMVVCLDISDIYDEAVHYSLVNDKIVFKKFFLITWIEDYTLLARKTFRKSRKFLGLDPKPKRTKEDKKMGIKHPFSLWTVYEPHFKKHGEIGLIKAKLHMDLLHQLLEESSIPLTLVIYPWPDQIFHNDLNSRQVQFWKEWAEDRGIPLINLFPYFVSQNEVPKNTISQLFIQEDVHWNKNGHRLVAETIIKEMPLLQNFRN